MKHFFRFSLKTVLFLTLSVISGSAYAQSHGYGFTGGTFGGAPGGFRYGIGGNLAISPRVTLGGEIGGIGSGFLGSGNVGFHFRSSVSSGLDPFFTGGFTVVQKGNTGFYGNLGGGANYWFHPRFGFRGEFRAYPGDNSFSELRFGISFR